MAIDAAITEALDAELANNPEQSEEFQAQFFAR